MWSLNYFTLAYLYKSGKSANPEASEDSNNTAISLVKRQLNKNGHTNVHMPASSRRKHTLHATLKWVGKVLKHMWCLVWKILFLIITEDKNVKLPVTINYTCADLKHNWCFCGILTHKFQGYCLYMLYGAAQNIQFIQHF
jgi:hypothetical protein